MRFMRLLEIIELVVYQIQNLNKQRKTLVLWPCPPAQKLSALIIQGKIHVGGWRTRGRRNRGMDNKVNAHQAKNRTNVRRLL